MCSELPYWIDCKANILLDDSYAMDKFNLQSLRQSILKKMDSRYFLYRSKVIRNAIDIEHIGRLMPLADVTIATAWDTVEPVIRFGSGRKVYFMQHFEPLFLPNPASRSINVNCPINCHLSVLPTPSGYLKRYPNILQSMVFQILSTNATMR